MGHSGLVMIDSSPDRMSHRLRLLASDLKSRNQAIRLSCPVRVWNLDTSKEESSSLSVDDVMMKCRAFLDKIANC